MKEKGLLAIIEIVLIFLGLMSFIACYETYISISEGEAVYSKFNFGGSELSINGYNVSETLNYHTDKDYHTLYRNFISQITSANVKEKNSFIIKNVKCSDGEPYFKYKGECYLKPDFLNPSYCPANTENNEYGCTFGDVYGFSGGKDYKISANLEINPENIFIINGNNYIKFIAYGKNNHARLKLNENFFIIGKATYKNEYSSDEDVIIYIPVDINEQYKNSYNVQQQDGFKYNDTKKEISQWIKTLAMIFILFFNLIPAISLLLCFLFFGKEKDFWNVPDELSQIPNDRKPWEVSTMFNYPIGQIGNNFLSTIFLGFYHNKIIDIKVKDDILSKNLLIKLTDTPANIKNLDKIELKVLNMLKYIKDNVKFDCFEDSFLHLNKAIRKLSFNFQLPQIYRDLQNMIRKESKNFLSYKGLIIYIVSLIIFIPVALLFSSFFYIFLAMISIFIVSISSIFIPFLSKYKEDYYKEYLEWQAFKKWLKGSPSIKEHGHKGVVLWEDYLIYATALGVSKKVLKELKNEGIIDARTYNNHAGFYLAMTSLSNSGFGGATSSGGGFSGAGGGGVGGGGGGGR